MLCFPDWSCSDLKEHIYVESSMKHYLIILSIILFSCASAMADWDETFTVNYAAYGIQFAVNEAVGDGRSPDQIIKVALPIKDIERKKLIKSLFCALALPGSIYDAAATNGIQETTVAEGYQLALAECAKEMEENLTVEFNPNNQLSQPTSERTQGSSQASPWNFQ